MKKITPLSEFPTEALLRNYRKNRRCDTRLDWIVTRYNRSKNMWEYWEPFLGEYTLDDGTYLNPVIIGYRRVDGADAIKKNTEITGNVIAWNKENPHFFYHTSEFEFEFEGMYWKGDIKELKAELARRPHVGNLDSKTFRKWKIEYKRRKEHN